MDELLAALGTDEGIDYGSHTGILIVDMRRKEKTDVAGNAYREDSGTGSAQCIQGTTTGVM
ncbi:restriction endonuclease [Sesbania bispinosa]|nr:restriction endonuclease [Sesbania bispinosa]